MPQVCPLCNRPVQIVGRFSICPDHGQVEPRFVAGPDDERYDLFISYAHKDDQGEYAGRVTSLKEWIEREFERVTSRNLRLFFDVDEIPAMSVWEHRILTGLRQSRIMLAVLSPNYFASEYCRREWEEYLNQELAHALPGEGIAPIYILKHPAFDEYDVNRSLNRWLQNLKRRQYVDCVDWWPQGQQALEREGVRRQLEQVRDQIVRRLDYAARRDASPHNLPPYNPRFVGRIDELHKIRDQLIRSQIGAITAVHGLGGIGKSALALVYGHAYGHEYPGGRFWINCAGLNDLSGAIIALAPLRGLHLTPAELARPNECLAQVRALFEQGPAALLILDNVDDPNLLSPAMRQAVLPRGDHIHVLATTRLQGSALQGLAWLSVDALAAEDALALLARYRPIADVPQDDEWKAAVAIVERLGGHALALEVVAVYLAEHPAISYREYLTGLVHDGTSLVEFAGATNEERATPLSLHVEQSLSKLLAPTLDALSPAERTAVEFAALLPPDHVPLPWLSTLLTEDFPHLASAHAPGRPDPLVELFDKLHRLRLIVPGDDPRIGRIHRIAQLVLRSRVSDEVRCQLGERLFRLALERTANMEAHWGPDCVWEVEPLSGFVTPQTNTDNREAAMMASVTANGLRKIGRSVEARRLYQRGLEIFERLASTLPDDVTAQRGLSVSYNQLGDLSRAEGDAAEARRLYQCGLEISERRGRALPDDVTAQRDLSLSYNQLADLNCAEGDLVGALGLYLRGLEIFERLVRTLPNDVIAQRDLSVSYIKLGDLSRAKGDPVEARHLCQCSLEIFERLASTFPDDVMAQRDLEVSYNRLGDLSFAERDPVEARRLYQRGLGISERLARMLPRDVQLQQDLVVSHCRLAQLAQHAGDEPSAREQFAACYTQLQRMIASGMPLDAQMQAVDTYLSGMFGGSGSIMT